jgi:Family of unknown function (DUF6492)
MLDAVLPLTLADLPRFHILARSIEANFDDLARCCVIVPDHQQDAMRIAMPHQRFVVVPETQIVPELAGSKAKGWYKQQLIKLAMADHVTSDYYLLFDADVICARPIRRHDLFRNGKALCHRYRNDNHANWYRWAERVLELPRSGWVHGVTPTILSREAVRELTAHLNRQEPRPLKFWQKLWSRLPEWAGGPRAWRNDHEDEGRWRRVLLDSLPWTEYALYFTFLEATGRFERYHTSALRSLCSDCIWRHDKFAEWDPTLPRPYRQPPFIVVQSIAKIPPEQILERIEPLFHATRERGDRQRMSA